MDPTAKGNSEYNDSQPEHASAYRYVWRSPWVRAVSWTLLIAAGITVLVLLFPRYSFVLTVAVVGFMVAYLLHPLVQKLHSWRIPRALAVILVYLGLLGLLVLGSILIAQIFGQLGTFVQKIPDVVDQAGDTVSKVTSWLTNLLAGFQSFIANQAGFESAEHLGTTIREQLSKVLERGTTSMADAFDNLLAGGPGILLGGATSIISGTAQVIFILLAGAYFLWDFPRITANFNRLVPPEWRPLYHDVTAKADRAVGGYLRGQILVSTVLGLAIWLGLALLKVPLALSIGFIAAVFNLVPYLGPIIAAVPGVLLALSVSPLTALLAVIIFVLANQLESNVLSPIILGKVVDIHPLTVLLAIMAGLSLFGLLGALLAVPVTTFVKLLYEDYVMTNSLYTGAGNDPGTARARVLGRAARKRPDSQ